MNIKRFSQRKIESKKYNSTINDLRELNGKFTGLSLSQKTQNIHEQRMKRTKNYHEMMVARKKYNDWKCFCGESNFANRRICRRCNRRNYKPSNNIVKNIIPKL